MIKVNPKTQMADRIRATYARAYEKNITDIYKAYNKPSAEKVEAWRYCKAVCDEFKGENLLIAGAGNYFFSAVFKFTDETTGRECIAWITKGGDRFTEAAA